VARANLNILQNAPELKNTSTASMLYVFGLERARRDDSAGAISQLPGFSPRS